MACYLFLYQRSTATAFDKFSYSYRTSIPSKVFWFSGHHWNIHLLAEYCFIFCAHMRRYCSSQQGKPLAGASARGLGGFGLLAAQFTPRPAECPRMRRSRFSGDKRHYLTAPHDGDCSSLERMKLCVWNACPRRSLASITSLRRDVWEQLGQLPRMGFTLCVRRPLTSMSHLSWAWVARAWATTLVSSSMYVQGVPELSEHTLLREYHGWR